MAALLRTPTNRGGSTASRDRPTTTFSAAETRKRRPGQDLQSRSADDAPRSAPGGSAAGAGIVGAGRPTACPVLVSCPCALDVDDIRSQQAGSASCATGDTVELMKLPATARFSTICIHAGQEPDPTTGAIITPIFQTSTYVQEELGQHKGYEYARTQNPTRAALEQNLAAIEGGKAAFAFASGMAAIDAITTLLEAGDHVVVTDNTYGGTFRLFDKVLTRYGLDVQLRRHVAAGARSSRRCGPKTKMLFVETPTNPVHAPDRPRRAAGDRARARRRGSSSTTRSPARAVQRPIAFGADLVIHSTTKYLNGHSDSVGGIVIAVRDEDIEWLKFIQNAAGAILSPFDSWLVLRGTKTLAVRMAQHNANGHGARGVPGDAPEGDAGALSRACRTIRSTSWRSGRCAASAACSRSTSGRSRPRAACATASA